MTVKYEIGNVYLRAFDERNWVVAKMVSNGKKGEVEKIYGYYPTLLSAKKSAFEYAGKQCKGNKELEAVLDKLLLIK